MKQVFSFCIIFIFVNLGLKAQNSDFTLLWADEFNYSGLPDSSKWSYDVGGHGWGNDELEYYTKARLENARVENGHLIIEARKENYKSMNYTSARLVTMGKGDWLYGRFDIRAKLPKGKGTWPAIWMLSSDWSYGAWPESGEIDIMEHVGYDPDVVHFSTHCLDYFFKIGTQKTAVKKVSRTDSLFHTYGVEWRPDRIDGFIDDSLYFSVSNEHLGWKKWPFDKPFHLILNIAVGGGWGGVMGIDENIWPQKMEVDYVRVYKYMKDEDNQAPIAPENLQCKALSNRLALTWNPGYDNYGVKKYNIFFDGKLAGTSKNHSFEIKDLQPATNYKVKVVAEDWKGNTSPVLEESYTTTALVYNEAPSKIEAEDFFADNGTKLEKTADTLGGYNLSWIEPGDWMEYNINVMQAGSYNFVFRAATERKDGIIQIIDEKGNILGSAAIGNTRSWQNWKNFSSSKIQLPSGKQKIKLNIVGDRVSLNWFEVKE